MPHNILYLSYDGMTDQLGQSQVIPYLQGLSREGYSFTLISFEKPERFEKGRAQVEALCKANGIDWQPLIYTKKPPVLSTVYDYQRMKAKAFALHKEKHFSIVHCRSYISAMAGLEMKRQLGIKFIFDMRGFWADERVEGNIWNLSNPIFKTVYNFFKKKEQQFFSQADYTISLTDAGKAEIQSWKSIPNQPIPIQVIPCCADLETFSRSNINQTLLLKLRQELGIKESDFVLSYLGSIGTWYMPAEMLDFFKCLLGKQPNAKFLFITNDEPSAIIGMAKQKGIAADKLIFRPSPRLEVPTYLALSNWSIFFIKPVFSKKASSPTKQGEIMGMGIPHICNIGVGDIDQIMQRTDSGYVVTRFSNTEYTKVVGEMLASAPSQQAIVQGARQYYSLQNGVQKYLSVYKKILS
ncbi:MAG: glycosyltransferase [Bacteroidetes bacterium]|nr:glycosyltransferase [Bacteroidota bacterium]